MTMRYEALSLAERHARGEYLSDKEVDELNASRAAGRGDAPTTKGADVARAIRRDAYYSANAWRGREWCDKNCPDGARESIAATGDSTTVDAAERMARRNAEAWKAP